MTLRILNFAANRAQATAKLTATKTEAPKTTLTPEQVAALRYKNSIMAKSQSKKLEEIYQSFEPTGFGLLYNYFCVETERLAPVGCKVASKQDFENLFNFLLGDNSGTKAGYLIKGARRNSGKVPYWNVSNPMPPSNLYLNVYGAGYRRINGSVSGIGDIGLFGTSTLITDETDPENPVYDFVQAKFQHDSNDVQLITIAEQASGNFKRFTSIRCILDPDSSQYRQWYPGYYITDIQGNKYGTMKFADTIWLTSNLMTTKFNNGQNIQSAYDPEYNSEESAYCFPNNAESNVGRSSQITR